MLRVYICSPKYEIQDKHLLSSSKVKEPFNLQGQYYLYFLLCAGSVLPVLSALCRVSTTCPFCFVQGQYYLSFLLCAGSVRPALSALCRVSTTFLLCAGSVLPVLFAVCRVSTTCSFCCVQGQYYLSFLLCAGSVLPILPAVSRSLHLGAHRTLCPQTGCQSLCSTGRAGKRCHACYVWMYVYVCGRSWGR